MIPMPSQINLMTKYTRDIKRVDPAALGAQYQPGAHQAASRPETLQYNAYAPGPGNIGLQADFATVTGCETISVRSRAASLLSTQLIVHDPRLLMC